MWTGEAIASRLDKTGDSDLFPRGFLWCNEAAPAVDTLLLGVAGTVVVDVGVSEE